MPYVDEKSQPVVPLRLRRALLLLHVWFWLAIACFSLVFIFTQAPPTWLLLFVVGGVFVGRVGFYVELARQLTRGLGRRPAIWVGACLLFWPLADVMVYLSLATQPKEWAARPDAATETP